MVSRAGVEPPSPTRTTHFSGSPYHKELPPSSCPVLGSPALSSPSQASPRPQAPSVPSFEDTENFCPHGLIWRMPFPSWVTQSTHYCSIESYRGNSLFHSQLSLRSCRTKLSLCQIPFLDSASWVLAGTLLMWPNSLRLNYPSVHGGTWRRTLFLRALLRGVAGLGLYSYITSVFWSLLSGNWRQ